MRAASLLAVVAAGSGAASLGASLVDALVLAALAGIPAWLWVPEPALRPRRRRELALVAGFAVLVAGTVVAATARALRIPFAAGEAALGACYLLGWSIALRFLRGGADGVLRWCGVPARPRGLLAALTVVVVGMPLLFVSLHSCRPKFVLPLVASGALGDGVAVTFTSRDGTPLSGTLYADGVARPGLVFCHGLGAGRAQVAPHAALAARLGCHVLLFDFRAHGASGGRRVTFGARERDDVLAAAACLRQNARVTAIALVGLSLGGASALLAAPDADVAGVFAESSFAELRAMTQHTLDVLPGIAGALTSIVALAARLQPGIDLDAVNPRAALARLDPRRQIVLLHGGADEVIPVAEGRRLAAARAGATLHVFPAAGHGNCLGADPGRYAYLLREFVGQCLRTIEPR